MATSEYLRRVIEIQARDRESGARTVYTSPAMSKLIDHAERLEYALAEAWTAAALGSGRVFTDPVIPQGVGSRRERITPGHFADIETPGSAGNMSKISKAFAAFCEKRGGELTPGRIKELSVEFFSQLETVGNAQGLTELERQQFTKWRLTNVEP